MKKGFTLIELLAVIIVLAVVALIATPIILNVVKDARKSADKSSVAMYADAVKLAVINKYFNDQKYPLISKVWAKGNVQYGGEKISCNDVYYTETDGVMLHECILGEEENNHSDDTLYCYIRGKIYTDCKDITYLSYYNAAKDGTSAILPDDEGVNKPQLTSEMKPIKWVDGKEIVLEDENDPEWYDYSNKKWANAKTKDGSYWVWIPRYAYKITEGYHTNTVGTIDIKFLKGITNETNDGTIIETSGYEVGKKDTSTHYFLHPAFQFNGEEYGFWMAKFEPTAAEGVASELLLGTCTSSNNVTTKTVKIVPNKRSWRCIDINHAYTVSKNMKNKTDVYGWNSEEVDTHLIKNTEWGAVAYLSKSIYGANAEIWNNAYIERETGCSGSSVDASDESTCVEYDTPNGVKASTTHNIYGVYDMSGGTLERVAGYVNNGNSNLQTYGASLANQSDLKYKNIYKVISDSQTNNYEVNKNVYGDAMYETSSDGASSSGSWYGDYSYMPYDYDLFFIRGGNISHSSGAGAFQFNVSQGEEGRTSSFRPVVFVIK